MLKRNGYKIPVDPPQKIYCERCGKPCKSAPLCRSCHAMEDTHRCKKSDPWTRAQR